MAKEFSKKFYRSKEWKKTREYIYNKYYGLCGECGLSGEEVHHIIPLTEKNMSDINITLGEDNLILLCRKCHFKKHDNKQNIINKNKFTKSGFKFNENGEFVQER